MTVKPFPAVRPDKKFAGIVHVPPYDVVDIEEVKAAVRNNAYSFFHVTRAEADIPGLVTYYSDEVYKKARENFENFINDGILVRDEKPFFYLISQTWNGKTQTGIYAAVSCEEYENGLIKKHESTRKDKESDRSRHIMTVRADTGPVFLAFEKTGEYDSLLMPIKKNEPLYELNDENNVEIKLWAVTDETLINNICNYFNNIPFLYIADGHHRAASAVNVWKALKSENHWHNGNEPYNYFMAVIFPSSELQILPYNRIVLDLKNLTKVQFLDRIGSFFILNETDKIQPDKKGNIIMYINKSLYLISPKKDTFNSSDPLESLDVNILQNNLLSKVLGIEDPRTSERIKFIGGIKGAEELIRQVDSGYAVVSFCMYPVSMGELIQVTDTNKVMPPKSTWFEPKLRDGLIVYTLD